MDELMKTAEKLSFFIEKFFLKDDPAIDTFIHFFRSIADLEKQDDNSVISYGFSCDH